MYRSQQPDPFSIETIKELTFSLHPINATWDGFLLNKSLESELLQLDEPELDLLPELKADVLQLKLDNVPLPDLSTSSSADSDNDEFQSLDGDSIQDDVADVWILPDIQKRRSKSILLSWDQFLDKGHQEPASGYISEAEPTILNAVLEANSQSPPRHVRSDVLLDAFFGLCMGRDTVLFRYKQEDHTFIAHWQNIAAHGCSPTLVRECFEAFAEMGTTTKSLTSSFQIMDAKPASLPPSQIAFLSASRSVLHAAHKYLGLVRPGIASLLQLMAMTATVRNTVRLLKQCTDDLKSGQMGHLFITSLIRQTSNASIDDPSLGKLMQTILSRTLQPILAVLSEDIGLSLDRRGSLAVEIGHRDQAAWEALLGLGSTYILHEAQQSMKLLRRHSPNCTLLSSSVLGSSPLKSLELGLTFHHICGLQARAVAYEEAMKSLITSAESSISSSLLSTPASEDFNLLGPRSTTMQSAGPFQLQMDIFNHKNHLVQVDRGDELEEQVIKYLTGKSKEDSHLEIDVEQSLGLSISPLISAQHRLLSYSVLRLLFQDHNLSGHINLQRNFHLLGNAFFSSRLTTALFDTEQSSGEGLRRTGATTGLRLQARDTWPPAGSELRLVLMSILSDSLTPKHRFLEDHVSFAIRDMPLEELEKCRDVNSIHALDFLRLTYAPPNGMVEAVITPEISDKYDRIFQHLLRSLRIKAVTQSLLLLGLARDSDTTSRYADHKTILEMHHFITGIADYCHNIAIETYWRKFQAVLSEAKAHIDSQNYEETLRVVGSLDHLRALHESTVDDILHALLLRRKQAKSRQILEDLYDVILRFSAETRETRSTDHGITMDANQLDAPTADETTIKRLRVDFRSKVLQFMDALRCEMRADEQVPGSDELTELDGDGKEVNTFEYLLLRLDMSGYWSGQTKRAQRMDILPVDLS